MENHSEKLKNVLVKMERFLTENAINLERQTSPLVPSYLTDKGFIVETYTTKFGLNYRFKYIYITPEQVFLIGTNPPTDYTPWSEIVGYSYNTKEEMLQLVRTLMYDEKINSVW